MSFDDGIEQDKRLIELMKKYELKGTFNLSGGLFGERCYVARLGDIGFMEIPEEGEIRRKIFKNSEHYRIPEDEIKQVYEGYEVASHAFKHELLTRLPAEKIIESLEKDIEVLSAIVGYPIKGHAYPGGMSSDVAASCLKEKGLLYGREAFTNGEFTFPKNALRYKPTCSHKDKKIFELFDQFMEAEPAEDDLLFSIWGHSYEFDYGTEKSSWESIEKVFQKIAGHTDVVYCTNAEAFENRTTE